ncbi:hypothetical protein [Nocardia sp. CDC160]|uniref:hypothetical protein n=1 Tax=Nocardia sp. CDC160 TaxID=3112166 RepID=UPI002DB5DAB9|nr:hypothetical protein [Nocardia sp. CDC160]MEC3916229.1 hypothetical protein [Nocardia sp. CDC160]
MSAVSRIAGICVAVAASFATALVPPLGSGPASAENTDAAKYFGTWNYDLPDNATLNNIDVLACPDGTGACDRDLPLPLRVPQVGWVTFAPGPNGTVDGHTDQGCTWNFAVHADGLELSSTTQECFNKNIGSAGNLTKWSVRVDGTKETESIVAISHQPNGVDIIGTMASGSRTKVGESAENKRFVDHYLGDFTYAPADFQTLTNVVSTSTGNAYPQQGTIHFTRKSDSTITAHTPDGCDWSLEVRGNTAELAPDTQTCHTPTGDLTLRYWGLATDGHQMNAFLSGSTPPATDIYLFVGDLTRSAT